MPRRRKRMSKLPGRAGNAATSRRFDEGYNPGDTGYYPGRAEGKPPPKEPDRGKPKRSLSPGHGGTPAAKEFIDRPGKRKAVGRPGEALITPPKGPKRRPGPSLSRPGSSASPIEGPKMLGKRRTPRKQTLAIIDDRALAPKIQRYQLPTGETPKLVSGARALATSSQPKRKQGARRT